MQVFDEIQRTGINVITNSNLSDTQWIQVSLPICDDGLGIRRAASLALPAFLASAPATAPLQHHILAPSTVQPDSAFEAAGAAWSNIFNQPQPKNTASQRAWDAVGKEKDKQSVWDAASSLQDNARVLAATATHSGDWLHALPISACGRRLDNEAIPVAVGLRLGLPLCAEHRCPCGAEVDPGGVHGLYVSKAPAGRLGISS